MLLNKRPTTQIEFDGKILHLVPWFDQVLDFMDVTEDCTPFETQHLALEFFVLERVEYDVRLFNLVWHEVFGDAKNTGENVVDFKQDAGRIYAGFIQAYGIDLYEQWGKMHWQTFCELLANLPSDTAFAEVVSIRTREIPQPTKYNSKERAKLIQLKARYAIKIPEAQRQRKLGSQWGSVWNALISRAKEGD